MVESNNEFKMSDESVKIFADRVIDRISDMLNNNKLHDNKIEILERRIDNLEDIVAKLLEKSGEIVVPTPNDPPENITFATGHSYEIKHWFEIVPETVKYLIEIGKFNLSEKMKDFVNTEPRTRSGKKYQHDLHASGYHINKYGSIKQCKERVTILLNECGIDPNSITYTTNANKPHKMKKPKRMIFPDSKEYKIEYWNDIIKSAVVHLVNSDKIVLSDKMRDFINVEPCNNNGTEYRVVCEIGDYYINIHGDSMAHVERTKRLLRANGIDPESIKYEY